MRTRGSLSKWNDDKGFGFVVLPQSREEIFVHISAFPRDGVRPRVGETISFEIHVAPNGRKRAEVVERVGFRKGSINRRATKGVRRSRSTGVLLAGAAVLILGFAGYNSYVSPEKPSAANLLSTAVEANNQPFSCDGRTHCSQMTSCAEARYFLRHCPGTQMDGDQDGEPCEQQWCD